MSESKHFAGLPLIKKVQHDAYFRCEELNHVSTKSDSILFQSLAKVSENPQALLSRMQTAYKVVKNEYPYVEANVCRIRLNGEHASFLSYDSLLKPHPELKQSVRVEFTDEGDVLDTKIRKENTQNPPILHRVENFFLPNTTEFKFHQSVTQQEEKLGVFEYSNKIGRKNEHNTILQNLQK